MVARDERAHFAACHLNAVLGGVQVGLHAIDVAIELVDVVRVRFGGQFRFHGSRQVGHLLVDGSGGVLVLTARLDEIRVRHVQLVRDYLDVTLQLLVDFVFLCQPLSQRIVGLFHGSLRGLLDALGLIECAPAHSEAKKGNATQQSHCQPDPPGCAARVRVGGI